MNNKSQIYQFRTSLEIPLLTSSIVNLLFLIQNGLFIVLTEHMNKEG